jgi:hypothetical protein
MEKGIDRDSGIVGTYGPTVLITLSDTAQPLSTTITRDGDYEAVAVYVTVYAYAAKVGYGGATPVYGASTLGHYYAVNEKFRIIGKGNVDLAKFVNFTSGQNAILSVTPEF